MFEHFFEEFVYMVIHLLESMGVIIIFISGIKAFYKYGCNLIRHTDYQIKIKFAQALTLALEFKLGAEILKTVIVRTMDEMFILAAIIILRAILAFVIHWEIKSEERHCQEKYKEECISHKSLL